MSDWKPSTFVPQRRKSQPADDPDSYMTREQAAKYLQVSYNTLKAWDIPHTRVKGRVRYSKAEIDKFLEQHKNRKWKPNHGIMQLGDS